MTEVRAGLPLTVTAPAERGDAARNRALLLDAARRLIDEHGTDAVTMDAVAAAVSELVARYPEAAKYTPGAIL